jgi:hypothetical protein
LPELVESWPVSLRRVPLLELLLPEQSRHVLPLVESRPVSLPRVLPQVLLMTGLLSDSEPPCLEWHPWRSGAL